MASTELWGQRSVAGDFPIGQRVMLLGHFAEPVVLEAVRPIGAGFECRAKSAAHCHSLQKQNFLISYVRDLSQLSLRRFLRISAITRLCARLASIPLARL
jgi:hypothetical protein